MTKKKSLRVNEDLLDINGQVRVICQDGAMAGLMEVQKAIEFANSQELDLIEIVPNANPPVCKVMDLGKYLFTSQKKSQQSPRSSKKMKEIKMNVNIGSHDFEVKMNKAIGFIESGHALRIVIFMRGRELRHRDLGAKLMEEVVNRIASLAKIKDDVQYVHNRIIANFFPDSTKITMVKKGKSQG